MDCLRCSELCIACMVDVIEIKPVKASWRSGRITMIRRGSRKPPLVGGALLLASLGPGCIDKYDSVGAMYTGEVAIRFAHSS